MKTSLLLVSFCTFLSLPLLAQQNNTLRGKMLFLSSGKKPAIGVEISGTIQEFEKTNIVYTAGDGSYQLLFPNARTGHKVKLEIGNEDERGGSIELVNAKEVGICRIPAKASDEFEIIVCRKGARDLVAEKYYNIIKTSSDLALAEKKKEMDELLAQQKKDYQKITELGEKLAKLEQQTDSLTIYKEAFHVASINKDNASKRVLRYIQLLDEGNSIQVAREALSIKGATKDLGASISQFKSAIEELETRAGASNAIFDNKDAITCYDTLIRYSEIMGINPLKISEYYVGIANAFNKEGNYNKALEYFQRVNDIREELFSPPHLTLAASYDNLGITYENLGHYEKALKYHQRALDIREEVLDLNDPDLALSYDNLSSAYSGLGQYEKALEFQQKALDIREEIFGPQDHDLSLSYNNIAVIYAYLGQFENVLEYQEKAIVIFEENLDSNHPDLAYSYGNIAGTYHYLGQYEKALEYHQRKIDIQEEILDPLHPDLANSYENIAITYRALGQFERALEFQYKSKSIKEKSFDSTHPDLAGLYFNMGNTYFDMEQYAKALEFQQKSLSISEETYNSEHPKMGMLYGNIASTYLEIREFEKAISFQERCLMILEKVLPENHPYQQLAFNNWLEIYYAKGADDFKNKEYTSALTNFDTIHYYADSSFNYLGEVWSYSGLCHYYMGNYPKAIKCFQGTVTFSPEVKEKDFYKNIGLAYAKNHQFKEAYAAFTEYEKLFPNQGKSHRNWAMYYASKNKKKKALFYLQKAVELGYDDAEWLKTDDSMDGLRKEKAFIDILGKLEKKKN